MGKEINRTIKINFQTSRNPQIQDGHLVAIIELRQIGCNMKSRHVTQCLDPYFHG